MIVEDDEKWMRALRGFYHNALKNYDLIIDEARSKEQALNKLKEASEKKESYDLLSLDINLGIRTSEDGQRMILEDGKGVLDQASALNACHSVAIVTGVHNDQEVS